MSDLLNTNIVLLSGFQASGKSNLAELYRVKGYIVLSRDTENLNKDKFLNMVKERLTTYQKVVIDNTFPTIDSRKPYIDLAKEMGLTIGVHSIDISMEDALINSFHRCYQRHGEIYMIDKEVPKDVKKNTPNSYIVNGIFNYRSKNNPKKRKISTEDPKLEHGFDAQLVTKFKRQKNPLYKNKAVFIDLDGTVRDCKSEAKYPLTKDDIRIFPEVEEILRSYKDNGWLIIAVTNQSGVAKGDLTYEECKALVEHTDDLLGNVIDDYHICHHSPRAYCGCRKPQSGSAIKFQHKHELDLTECYMVGDRTTDKTYAERVGMKFYYAKDFFNL